MKAIVAWDNLGGPDPDAVADARRGAGGARDDRREGLPADPADRTIVPITKPALGMSADYGLPPEPNTSLPNPRAKSEESLAYTAAGVDSGEIIIRGGSHLDFSFIPNQAFGASLRGRGRDRLVHDSPWFDKYLKHQRSADKRLLTNRWREDPSRPPSTPTTTATRSPSTTTPAWTSTSPNGKVCDCENLRKGCPGMVPESDDGFPGTYSYLALDTSPDKG